MTARPAAASRFDVRATTDHDRAVIDELSRQAFGIPADDFRWRHGGRVLVDGGTIKAGLCLQRFEQFFGGRSVASGGLAWAVVPPEARGRGYSKILARQLLAELKGSGALISTIHPVSLRMWRHLGCEVALARTTYEADVERIRVPPGDAPALERRRPEDLDGIASCYRRIAAAGDGLVNRSRAWWRRVVLPAAPDDWFVYAAVSGREVAGYLLYDHEPVGGAFEYHRIRCHELMWSGAEAAAGLLAFLAGHRSMATSVSWPGPPNDPLEHYFDQGHVRLRSRVHCVLRLLDVAKALEARGYLPGADEQVSLEVTDPLFADNNGVFRIRVQGMTAGVARVESPAPRIDVGALAAIYSGWLHPADARRLGRFKRASDGDVAALARIFAPSRPWIVEPV